MIAGLYRRYAPELVRYIRKYTEDQAAAEDIVQETFVRGMEHGSQLEMLEESQRRAWLYRTAKNICIDRARRVQAEPPWEGEAFQNDDLTKPMVMQLCGILEPQDRAMFWLRYFEDYTAAELGEMFGIPAATVRSRMLNAAEILSGNQTMKRGNENGRKKSTVNRYDDLRSENGFGGNTAVL